MPACVPDSLKSVTGGGGHCYSTLQAQLCPAQGATPPKDGRTEKIPKKILAPKKEVTLRRGDAFITFFPEGTQRLTYGIDHLQEAPIIGKQWLSWAPADGQHYRWHIAPARTYAASLQVCAVDYLACTCDCLIQHACRPPQHFPPALLSTQLASLMQHAGQPPSAPTHLPLGVGLHSMHAHLDGLFPPCIPSPLPEACSMLGLVLLHARACLLHGCAACMASHTVLLAALPRACQRHFCNAFPRLLTGSSVCEKDVTVNRYARCLRLAVCMYPRSKSWNTVCASSRQIRLHKKQRCTCLIPSLQPFSLFFCSEGFLQAFKAS